MIKINNNCRKTWARYNDPQNVNVVNSLILIEEYVQEIR